MNVIENASLKSLNTMAIDGRAEYLVKVGSLEGVREALAFSEEKNCPVKVLGGGSNVILADSVAA